MLDIHGAFVNFDLSWKCAPLTCAMGFFLLTCHIANPPSSPPETETYRVQYWISYWISYRTISYRIVYRIIRDIVLYWYRIASYRIAVLYGTVSTSPQVTRLVNSYVTLPARWPWRHNRWTRPFGWIPAETPRRSEMQWNANCERWEVRGERW
jgi:hypothetical protein